MIEAIHKQAIIKLINYFTSPASDPGTIISTAHNTSSGSDSHNDGNNSGDSNNNIQLYRFKDQIATIDLTTLTRLGTVIAMFEKVFMPNTSVLSGPLANLKIPYDSANVLHLQNLTSVIHFIESNNLFLNFSDNSLEAYQQLQSSQHLHMLLVIMREWLMRFYSERNIICSLFPTINTSDSTFALIDIKESNICIMSLFVFNVFYKLQDSFPKYKLALDFAWMNFSNLERFIEMASLNNEYVLSLLQTTLLYARIEEDNEHLINADLYKQIDQCKNKINETKKRIIHSIAINNKTPLTKAAIAINSASDQQMVRIATSSRPTNPLKSSASVNHSGGGGQHNNMNKSIDYMYALEKPYRCNACNKTFPTSYKLNRHSYSHSGERPYMCTWPSCLKRFNDNYHLRRHMNTHTGEKPFPCKYPGCSKRYSRSEDLRNHQKTHYSNNSLDGGGGVSGNANPGAVAVSVQQQQQQLNQAMNVNVNNTTDQQQHHTLQQHHQHPNNVDAVSLSQVLQQQQQQHQQHQQSLGNTNVPNNVALSSAVTFSLANASLPQMAVSKAAVLAATDHNNHTDQSQLVLQSHLNQIQLQLQQQSQQQQQASQQQQQQAQNQFNASLSPNVNQVQLGPDDASLVQPTIISIQEVANAAVANATQNHVATALHLSDNFF